MSGTCPSSSSRGGLPSRLRLAVVGRCHRGRQTGKTLFAAARVALAVSAARPGRRAASLASTASAAAGCLHCSGPHAALARWHEHVDLLMAASAEHVAQVVLQRGDEAVRFVNGSHVHDRHTVADRCPRYGARSGDHRRGDDPSDRVVGRGPADDGATRRCRGCFGAQLSSSRMPVMNADAVERAARARPPRRARAGHVAGLVRVVLCR